MGWIIAGMVFLAAAFLVYVKDQDEVEIPMYCIILALCMFAVAFIVHQSADEEKACIDRGGEVVHYGRLGTGVDCINVPK